jgi:MFS family permease
MGHKVHRNHVTIEAARREHASYRWLIVGGVIAVAFVGGGMTWYMMGIFFSPLVEEFGWGRGAYSVAISLYLSISTLSSMPIGRMVDRLGPRRVMIGATIATGLVCGLISQMGRIGRGSALWQLYALYILLAITSAGVATVPTSAIIARWFTERRGLAMGLSIVGFGLPGVLVVPLSAPFIAQYGWRALALALGALCWIVSLPVVLWVLRDSPPQPPDDGSVSPTTQGIAATDALHSLPFWLMGTVFMLAQFSSVAVQLHAIPFLTDRGLSRELASTVWSSLALAGIVGKTGLGYAADRFRSKTVLLMSLLLQASALAIALTWSGMAGAWLFALLFGLGMGGQFSSRPLMVGEYFGLRAFGTIAGSIWLFTLPGQAAGQPVAGFLFDLTGSYALPYTMFIGAYLLATAVLLLLRKPSPVAEE